VLTIIGHINHLNDTWILAHSKKQTLNYVYLLLRLGDKYEIIWIYTDFLSLTTLVPYLDKYFKFQIDFLVINTHLMAKWRNRSFVHANLIDLCINTFFAAEGRKSSGHK
jgi:hypothetical protein